MSEAPPLFPWHVRLAFVVGLGLGALGLAEGAIRVLDGNAFVQVGIYEVREGRVVLEADQTLRLRRPDGHVYTLSTDADGLRLPEGGDTLLVGDSQALGLGVADEDTFAAQLGLRNAGVPGHGVIDAVVSARTLAPRLGVRRVVVLLNQANDWVDGDRPATERYRVAGGWLGSPDRADSLAGWFWASPLSRLHVFGMAALLAEGRTMIAPPQPGAAEARALTATFGAALRALRADLPAVELVPVYLPADAATSQARAAVSPLGLPGEPWHDRTLRDGVVAELADFPLVDLTPALLDPADFLELDFHLSEQGHRAVAAALRPSLGR